MVQVIRKLLQLFDSAINLGNQARSEEDLGAIFKFRPDLVTPVPNDFSALAARATSTPSLVRARSSSAKVIATVDITGQFMILEELVELKSFLGLPLAELQHLPLYSHQER